MAIDYASFNKRAKATGKKIGRAQFFNERHQRRTQFAARMAEMDKQQAFQKAQTKAANDQRTKENEAAIVGRQDLARAKAKGASEAASTKRIQEVDDFNVDQTNKLLLDPTTGKPTNADVLGRALLGDSFKDLSPTDQQAWWNQNKDKDFRRPGGTPRAVGAIGEATEVIAPTKIADAWEYVTIPNQVDMNGVAVSNVVRVKKAPQGQENLVGQNVSISQGPEGTIRTPVQTTGRPSTEEGAKHALVDRRAMAGHREMLSTVHRGMVASSFMIRNLRPDVLGIPGGVASILTTIDSTLLGLTGSEEDMRADRNNALRLALQETNDMLGDNRLSTDELASISAGMDDKAKSLSYAYLLFLRNGDKKLGAEQIKQELKDMKGWSSVIMARKIHSRASEMYQGGQRASFALLKGDNVLRDEHSGILLNSNLTPSKMTLISKGEYQGYYAYRVPEVFAKEEANPSVILISPTGDITLSFASTERKEEVPQLLRRPEE